MPQRENVAGMRRGNRRRHLHLSVVKERRPPTHHDPHAAAYRTPMGDGSEVRETWGEYLRRMTSRPGWSVARLGRDSGIHRATIFKWIKGERGATVASVKAIATALGDTTGAAMRAAAGSGIVEEELDPDLQVIMRRLGDPDVNEDEKTAIRTALRYLREVAERADRPGRVIRKADQREAS